MIAKAIRICGVIILLGICGRPGFADIPLIINHQGFIQVDGAPFDGTGTFRFGIIDSSDLWLWTHDDTQIGLDAGSAAAPTNSPLSTLSITVTRGVYTVPLGDLAVPDMLSALSSSVFDTDDVRLRVLFDDGTPNGEQALSPDQRIKSTAYAFVAAEADHATNADLATEATSLQVGAINFVESISSGNFATSTETAVVVTGSGGATVEAIITSNGRPLLVSLEGQFGFGPPDTGGAVGLHLYREDVSSPGAFLIKTMILLTNHNTVIPLYASIIDHAPAGTWRFFLQTTITNGNGREVLVQTMSIKVFEL